jgi:diguanylate cyclase (GGDEF)-like protein
VTFREPPALPVQKSLSALVLPALGRRVSDRRHRSEPGQLGVQQSPISRVLVHGIAATMIVVLLWHDVAFLTLASWVVMGALTLALSWRADQTRPNLLGRAAAAMSTAVAWTVPLFLVTADFQVPLWMASAVLLGASAILLPSRPRSTYTLAATLGVTYTVSFLVTGDTAIAIVALIFSLVTIVGAAENGRRYRAARYALALMREKQDVVSLLLHEFEEGDADWLWQVDTSYRMRSASPRCAFALAKEPRAIEGVPLITLLDPGADETTPNHPSIDDLAGRLIRREPFSGLPVRVLVNDKPRWWEMSGTPRNDPQGNFSGFHGVASDITAERESSEKIAYLARYDTLTGLPNRSMLSENLGHALAQAQRNATRCAFLMIDLDRFKAVNDTLGHQVGDQLLARVSERLREQVGVEEMCCRMGGDEFAVVICDIADEGEVARMAERLIERLSEPYAIGHHMLFVGASVGSAIGPDDAATVETLMRNADLALYGAKDAGGNVHYTYEPSLHAHAEERRMLESALRGALEAGEFEVHYQPVVDADTESVLSLEALLRWTSPEHGAISPAKFVPVAEDTRLVIPIGEWVLRRACLEAVRWPEHIRVAVNVSGEQLLDPDFPPMVVSALANSGLAPQRLEIEVTESIFVRDAALARSVLEQVIALGCTVALDDFGTGYSSLGYLRELRFSTIKIDRTFVQGAADGNRECLAIIRAVVAMAESLEMSTTAEGVETLAELDVVRGLGCRKIQGFHFGRPMTATDASQLFDTRRLGAR